MKKAISTLALLVVMLGTARLYAADEREYSVDNLYVTSYYTVEVYENNHRVGFLYAGVRAKVLRSAKHWLYVQFWDGNKTVRGWIRR